MNSKGSIRMLRYEGGLKSVTKNELSENKGYDKIFKLEKEGQRGIKKKYTGDTISVHITKIVR